jgi:hypothetical protein
MSNTPILTITLRQAENLVAFFGGHDTEVSVGPSLDGTQSLMAWCTEYPEEGAVDLGPTEVDDELANIGRPIALNAPAGEVSRRKFEDYVRSQWTAGYACPQVGEGYADPKVDFAWHALSALSRAPEGCEVGHVLGRG